MAIIRCPECGNSISDKAPTCPSCGVEIAGKITVCPDCGQAYLSSEAECPHCRKAKATAAETASPNTEPKSGPAPQQTATSATDNGGKPASQKKSNRNVLIVSFVIALLICATVLYLYKDSQQSKEQEDYEYAMTSSDSLVLRSYLERYPDASAAHIDSINAHLRMLHISDQEWTNALVSNSRSTFEAYLESHPDTPHKAEILLKLDSIDWQMAKSANTLEAYQAYLSEHASGEFANEASDGIKQIKAKTVSPAEQQTVQNVFRQFFQSLNSHDENGLISTLENTITSFLGKSDANQNDAIEFMNRLYKETIESMLWTTSDFKITKKEVGDEEYEFTVTFTATQTVRHNNAQPETVNTYRVTAKLSPQNLISMLGMTKIME